MSTRKSFGTAYSAHSAGGGGAAAPLAGALSSLNMATMYSTVIKLSTENKITAANTWSLPLIDHMESLLELGAPAAPAPPAPAAAAARQPPAPPPAVATAALPRAQKFDARSAAAAEAAAMLNFQRASCALDASTKIYASRVDDTYCTSYRVLDSLSRSGAPAAAPPSSAGEGASGADGDATSTAAAPPKSGRGARLAVGESATLERNPAAITLSSLEVGGGRQAADALSHKLAAGYDEAGVAGLLLHRLTVAPDASVAFDCLDAEDVDVLPAAGIAWAPGGNLDGALLTLPADALAPLTTALAGMTLAALPLAPTLATMRRDIDTYCATLAQSPLSATAAALAALQPTAAAAAAVPAPAATGPAPPSPDAGGGTPTSPASSPAADDAGAAADAAEAPTDSVSHNAAWAAVLEERNAMAAAAAPVTSWEDASSGVGGGGGGGDDSDGGEYYGGGADGDDGDAGDAGSAPPPRTPVRGEAAPPVDVAALAAAMANAHMPLAAAVALSHTPFKPGARGAAHWKLRATANAAAAVVAAGDDGGAAAVAAVAGGRRGAAKKRAPKSKEPVIATDLTVPLPPTAFARAAVKPPPASRRGLGTAAAAAAAAAATALPATDSEMLSAAAQARAAAKGHMQHIIPAALWGADILGGSMTPRVADASLTSRASGPLCALLSLSHFPTLSLRPAGTGDGDAPPFHAALAARAGPPPSPGAPAPAPLVWDAAGADDDGDDYAGDGGGCDDTFVGDVAAAATPATAPPAAAATVPAMDVGVQAPPATPGESPSVDAATPPASVAAPAPGGDADVAAIGDVRKVERIAIRYDSVAKRVDVAALKADMWAHLARQRLPASRHTAMEARCRAAAAAADGNLAAAFTDTSGAAAGGAAGAPPTTTTTTTAAAGGAEAVSLVSTISHLAPAMSSAVSVPFYFITLLHLANEHDLTITPPSPPGADALGDCAIGKLA